MKKSLAAGCLLLATLAAAPASAAQFILAIGPGAGSADFGNTATASAPLADMFTFSVPAGSANGFLGSIALSGTLDVVVDSVFLDGTPFTRVSSGAFDLFSLSPTRIAAGNHSISVNGNWGADGGSYAGTLNYIAAIPEPATWVMLIGGFGLIGGTMRRRNRARPAVGRA